MSCVRAGVEARIDGRPKHIYSIWRKMQAKKLAFEQIMDIRAARVLVDTVADATQRSASCIRCGNSFPASSTITSRRRNTTSIARSTPPCSVPEARRWRSRSARTKCTPTPSAAWPLIGATRKAAAATRRTSARSISCVRCSPPKRRIRHTTFSTACARSSFRTASTCFRPRERSSMCPWAARPRTSLIRYTPISVTAPAAPR